ncbi:uncharacterized protein LOC106373929 [Brassica napus]|uniref:uncharacterized protein LOC106373929 n=1 Tax=Brassica napus TaxID=3708 RepID=UPI002078AAE5|nr:uncharacterized protein LOC106373929 [Brassica napus]
MAGCFLQFTWIAMTSVPGTDSLAWTDEQTRFYLKLRVEEKLKGNERKGNLNEVGRQSIIDKFYEAYGERHVWRKFGIKHTTCKTQYARFKRLINKRTGLGYDANGYVDMSDDWWDQLFKEFPSARKLKENPLANVDLLENVFGAVHVSGGEGWTAQQGEDSLDKQGDNNDGDAEDTDVDQVPPTQDISAPAESRTAGPSSSRTKANRKRSTAQVGQAVVDCLSDKNKMIGNHLEFSCNQLTAMEALHSLSAIRHWSPLYKAAIDHLKQDPTNRQTFLFYKDDEDKVLYLEYATGESRDA